MSHPLNRGPVYIDPIEVTTLGMEADRCGWGPVLHMKLPQLIVTQVNNPVNIQ